MSGERVGIKSKIPLKVKSCIPVRINENKNCAAESDKTTEDRNKPAPSSQCVTSKEKLKRGCPRPEISTKKNLKTKQAIQVKNEGCTKPSFKETNRAKLKVNNPSNKICKSYKPVKPSTPVPFVKTKIKVQPTRSKNVAESHPSQPGIEFVPDEVSRKRILGCIDLPSAPNAMSRGQTSIYDRPSLYRLNPVARPSDPCKALLKTLESLKIKDRRDTVQSTNWRESFSFNRPSVNKIRLQPPDLAALKTLDNIDCEDWSLKQSGMQATFGSRGFSLARKTPKMVMEEAKKRFQEQKLKGENKSVKKVTFQVLNSARGKENECLIESKPCDNPKTISENSTPGLKLRKTITEKDETPTSVKFPFEESQAASLLNSNLPKKPVSILKNKIFTETDMRRGSLFSSRPMRTGFGKIRRSISFSNFPLPTPRQTCTVDENSSNQCRGVQVQSSVPVDDLKAGQLSRPAFRRSLSSPEIAPLGFSTAAPAPLLPSPNPEVQASSVNLFSHAHGSICKLQQFKTNNIVDKLRSSVSASGLRGSLFLANNLKEVPQSKNPKLCTPVPVSLYPRSQTANSFSPEFLCPRSSNYIVDAPIKTPLVLKNLAAREENDDLSQVRQRLIFMPPAEEIPKKHALNYANKQNKQDYSADQECNSILLNALFPYVCSRNILLNPIAKTLENGDEMHFVPVSPCT